MNIKIVVLKAGGRSNEVERFLHRPAFDARAEESARSVLADIRGRGWDAVLKYIEEFEGVRLSPSGVRVQADELAQARGKIDAAFRKAVATVRRNIGRFARAGIKHDWTIRTPGGGWLGEQFVPYERVGVYVPGGTAPLASTALMTATLAKVAGVKEIVACTPCGKDGAVNPFLLYALEQAGATEIYKIGGIQAVGLMAYGVTGIPRVQKIVGPGGPYVTAAKRVVYGDVALDLVAGPSEIAVLADGSADPDYVAADLLSQAEHGTGFEKSLCVTTSATLAGAVCAALETQAATLGRAALVRKVADRNGILIVVVDNLAAGVALCNRFAPEHLELLVRNPGSVRRKIRCAGAVFIGPWTPESAGDFVAGPSHVLPTGGSAAMFSGLTVDDFRRRSSLIAYTRKDLKAALPVIEAFGRVEGLDGHARSAAIRFKKS